MKLKNIILYLSVFVFATAQLIAQNTNPVVSNVAFSISGTTVTVTYDVSDAEEGSFTIYMDVSDDGGTTWDYDYGATSGDIGTGISAGVSKSIEWTYSGAENSNMKIRISADDLYGDQIYYGRQIYNTVTIAGKTWLKENINIGTMLPNAATKATDNGIIEKHCYNDLESNCDLYGGLYRWDELMQYATTEGAQGICPTGWHVPSVADYRSLNTVITTCSELMVDGTNTTGFSAIRGAYMWTDNNYYSESGGYINIYYSDSESGGTEPYSIFITENQNDVGEYTNSAVTPEYAVRCIKD